MLKDLMWKTFENTGNIEVYVFYKEIVEKDKVLLEDISKEEVAISK